MHKHLMYRFMNIQIKYILYPNNTDGIQCTVNSIGFSIFEPREKKRSVN